MRKAKKLAAIVMMVMMVASLLPMTSFAATKKSAPTKNYTVTIQYKYYSSGKAAAKYYKRTFKKNTTTKWISVAVPQKKGYTVSLAKRSGAAAKKNVSVNLNTKTKKFSYKINKINGNVTFKLVYKKKPASKPATPKPATPKPATPKPEEPVVEVPVEEPVVETPAEKPVVETPAEKPVVETPAEEPVVEPPIVEPPSEPVVVTAVDPEADDKTFEADAPDNVKLTVNAPEGAFPSDDTTMKVQKKSASKSFRALDISFESAGSEIEPEKPVEVTWEADDIVAGETWIFHIKDDGTVELVEDAVIVDGKAVFTASEFSTYTTTRLDTIDLTASYANAIVFENVADSDRPASMSSGELSSTAPEIEGYTFVDATYKKEGVESSDKVTYLGAFIYQEEGADPVTYVYYRTESTASDSDLIVKLADDETIHLNYVATPHKVTYKVVYGGTEYIIGEDELPAELDDMVVTGPSSVAPGTTYEQAVKVSLPRGYSATVKMSNESSAQAPALGAGSEPNYRCTDGWTVTPDENTFTINGLYTIANVNEDLTVTIDLSKRTSYQFTAVPAFSTAYFGGTGTNARYQNANPSSLTGTISASTHEFTFTFTTRNQNNIIWALDSFNINKETIIVPFVNANSTIAEATTVLTSGTVINLSAEYLANGNRRYTVSISDCYENITITGGNLHNLRDKQEWVVQETLHISEFDYGPTPWIPLKIGEPMSFNQNDDMSGYWEVGTGPNPTATATHYYNPQRVRVGWTWYAAGYYPVGANPYPNREGTHYQYEGTGYTPRAIRFKVAEGYVNPQIKYITSEGTDQYDRVGDLTLESSATDQYHLVTSEPDADGYYYFSLLGTETDPGLLSIRAELERFGADYAVGEGPAAADVTIPAFDDGGHYDDGTLQGYNIIDNAYVVVADSAPVDTSKEYIFTYYTIQGGSADDHYAPSQKIPLKDISQYAVYDEEKGESVITFIAHWQEKTSETPINFTAHVFIDDEDVKDVTTVVPKNSSVYVDIDSETMKKVMDDYNWQLFYDEMGSDPFISDVSEDNNEVELRLYSKFYVYHSATNTLELHTMKEAETIDDQGNRKIDTFDITKLVTDGYYYGGYYKDYLGAADHAIKKAADANNNDGTLTTQDIKDLSDGKGVTIPEYGDGKDYSGTQYDPVTNEDHLAFWSRSNAFTTAVKTCDDSWCGDRGSKDTVELTTGGKGTEVKLARAAIYCLHEVPADYLAAPKVAEVRDNYGQGNLTQLFFLSDVDVSIFRQGGIKVDTSDKKGSFAKTFTLQRYDSSSGSVDTDSKETVTSKDDKMFGAYGYLTLFDASSYIGQGEVTLDPYWITYDNVTIHSTDVGEGHTRTITISNTEVTGD